MRRQGAEVDQLEELGGGEDELADVHRGPAATDALEDDVQSMAIRQHRVHERPTDVDPPSGALEHPFDELLHLTPDQDQVRQLVAPAGDEDPRRVVDPEQSPHMWQPLAGVGIWPLPCGNVHLAR